MKKLLFAFMAITLFACSSDDSAPANPNNGNPNPENPNPENPNPVECTNVYTGNVFFKTQAEVDAFAANGYCKIDGILYIGAPENIPSTDITDISALSGLVAVTKMIILDKNENLVSLNGLQNIKDLKEIRIGACPLLTNLEGCPDIMEGGKVQLGAAQISLQGLQLKNFMLLGIFADTDLGYFASFPNVEILSELTIMGNKATTLAGLENIKKIGVLGLKHNSNLVSLQGLENVTKIEVIDFYNNPELVTLEHLSGVTAIETIPEITDSNVFPRFKISGNAKLQSLNGLHNIVHYEGMMMSFMANPSLTDYCAIKTCLQNNPEIQWGAYNNIFNPTKENILAGNCSQP